MVKMIALYKRPEDVPTFMSHLLDVHMPIVRQFPGIRRIEMNHMFDMRGADANPLIMVEVFFDSREDLITALKSPSGRESGRDAQEFAGNYVQVMFANVEVEAF